MDRYEPVPGIAELPAWLWRRTGWVTRVALALALIAITAALAVVIPAQLAASDQRAAAAERARAAAAERRARAIQADQRPHHRRTSVRPRTRALADLRAEIRGDALRRVRAGTLNGPIRTVECERFPRSDGVPPPERDPSVRRGRYSCLAVTTTFEGGSLGHPYRALIDFETGRYAYCKITGRPEAARDPRLATPSECGG